MHRKKTQEEKAELWDEFSGLARVSFVFALIGGGLEMLFGSGDWEMILIIMGSWAGLIYLGLVVG